MSRRPSKCPSTHLSWGHSHANSRPDAGRAGQQTGHLLDPVSRRLDVGSDVRRRQKVAYAAHPPDAVKEFHLVGTSALDSPHGLVGRDAELARLRALVDPVPDESRVLVVLGEAGMGKTVLLADVASIAGNAGMRVLSVAGRESESNLAFA